MTDALSRTAPGPRALRVRPEPSRCWLRYLPEAWSSAGGPWTDLGRGGLGREDERLARGGWPPPGLDDLVYVPPGATPGEGAEAVCLVQLAPGQTASAGTRVVYDLLATLLAGDLDALAALPAGATAVWPLVAGVTDDPAMWRSALERLVGAGVRHVQPLALALTPRDRRRFAEAGRQEAFDALFHGAAPSERAFAAAARSAGAGVFAPRPIVGVEGRAASNRRLAGGLILAGELWLRCGRGEAEGQALLRAGRWLDATDHDVTALAREGNLDRVPALDRRSAEIVRALVASGRSAVLEELEEQYASGGETP